MTPQRTVQRRLPRVHSARHAQQHALAWHCDVTDAAEDDALVRLLAAVGVGVKGEDELAVLRHLAADILHKMSRGVGLV